MSRKWRFETAPLADEKQREAEIERVIDRAPEFDVRRVGAVGIWRGRFLG